VEKLAQPELANCVFSVERVFEIIRITSPPLDLIRRVSVLFLAVMIIPDNTDGNINNL